MATAIEVRLISWNLLHTVGAGADQVAAVIAEHSPDLMLMQEATAAIDTLPERAGGHYTRVALPGRLHGLAAWSRTKLQKPATSLNLQRGLIVRRVCQMLAFQEFGIANVHLSHGQVLNRLQLRRIAAALPAQAVICGDCNMVGAPLLPGFRDVGARQATHRSARLVPLRLDRCFVRGLRCTSAEVLSRGASDHRPLFLVLEPA